MHRSSNADIGGVVSLPERPNHTTRMVRPRGVLEILHNCLITCVHTTTHLSRQHATAPRTSWAHHPVWMSRHTRGSRQDIHSTRVPHTEEGRGWLSSTHRHKESKPPQWTSTVFFFFCAFFFLCFFFLFVFSFVFFRDFFSFFFSCFFFFVFFFRVFFFS